MKFNNETIRTAVKEWLTGPKKAEKNTGIFLIGMLVMLLI